MEIIDRAFTHQAGVVTAPGVSGIFSVYGHRNSRFIQLHGVGRKGDRDIETLSRL